jgi:outer membrane protein assembly factor BamB
MSTNPKLAGFIILLLLLGWHPAAAQKSVAYQINPEHTGATEFAQGFDGPLHRVWSRTFSRGPFLPYPTRMSYPVIAEGKVFVIVSAYSPKQGMKLMALSLATGKTIWSKGLGQLLRFGSGGLAFDGGRLFVVSRGGVQALAPDTGAELWTTRLSDQSVFTAPPAARDKRLYLSGTGGGGTIFALNQRTGRVLWKQMVLGGSVSSPTVTTDGIFVAYPCQVYKFSQTGVELWRYNGGCSGGGGSTAPIYLNQLYAREHDLQGGHVGVYDASDGTRVREAENVLRPPAFHGGIGYLPKSDRLTAWNVATKQTLWEFTRAQAPALPPLVINGKVIVVSHGGDLFVLDGTSGAELQHITLGAEVQFNVEHDGDLRKGMAAGEGMLIVPTGDTLSAFKSAH